MVKFEINKDDNSAINRLRDVISSGPNSHTFPFYNKGLPGHR